MSVFALSALWKDRQNTHTAFGFERQSMFPFAVAFSTSSVYRTHLLRIYEINVSVSLRPRQKISRLVHPPKEYRRFSALAMTNPSFPFSSRRPDGVSRQKERIGRSPFLIRPAQSDEANSDSWNHGIGRCEPATEITGYQHRTLQ